MNNQTYRTQLEIERVGTVATLNRISESASPDGPLTKRQIRSKLHRIEAALQRLAEQNYGICQECQMSIDPERLQALPYTELCYSCQRWLEKQTLQSHRLGVVAFRSGK